MSKIDRNSSRPVSRNAARPSAPPKTLRGSRGGTGGGGGGLKSGEWLYGRHTVLAALHNPNRTLGCLYVSEAAEGDEALWQAADQRDIQPQRASATDLARWLPIGAVHQGIVLQAKPLEQPHLLDFLDELPTRLGEGQGGRLLLLDHVVDPQNLGSLLRSAAAFGALAVIVTHDRSPPLNATVAKAASGAVEIVPVITVANLGQAMAKVKEAGFWCVGLDEGGSQTLDQVRLGNRIALVLGAEGDGLRRLTRSQCDLVAQLPTNPAFPTLNAAVAGAVALYQLCLGEQGV